MATSNTIQVLNLSTPFTYIVQSAKNGDYAKAALYTVNTHKMTCNCPHGTYSQGVAAKPCKHITFCKNIEQEAQLKNFCHYNLVKKGIRVSKVLKVTRIIKAGKKTQIASVSYITEHGKKGCCFMNMVTMAKERFFEIYENRANEEGGRTLRVSINGNLDTSLHYVLGYQFDLVFQHGGYTKFAYGEMGVYEGFKSIDIYEAMTSILLPVRARDEYMEYIRGTKKLMNKLPMDDMEQARVLNSYFQHCGVNLYYIVGCSLEAVKERAEKRASRSITWMNRDEITEYKKHLVLA